MVARISMVLFLSGITIFADGDNSEENPAPWALPEIVVTSSRAPRDVQSEPSAVHIIDAQAEVNRYGARTTAATLKGTPSVLLQKTSNAQTSPFLRGFTGYQTLALIDGVRLNNAVFRSGPNQYWNTIDPYSIATYELVLGPGSVMYGSDAIGGVLNALTPDVPEWAGEASWENSVHYRVSSAEDSHIGRWSTAARLHPSLGMRAGFTLKEFGDLRGGKDVGRQDQTGYDEYAVDGKVTYFIQEDASLTLAHQTVRQDEAWRTHRTVFGINWEGLTNGDDLVHRFDQSRDLTYARFDAANVGTWANRMQLTLSRHAQGEERDRVRASGRRTLDGFDVESLGASLQVEADHALGALVYGADYYRDDISSFAEDINDQGEVTGRGLQGPVAGDAQYDLAGAFAQNTTPLAGGVADLIVGARYTYARADAKEVEDPATGQPTTVREDWDAVTGNLRLLWPVTEDRRHVAYAGVAQAFRAPTVHDLTSFGVARSDEIEIPSPELDTEDYVTYELGWKSRTKDWVVQLAYYYTQVDGLIVKTATGRERDGFREVTKSNARDGYVQGAEAGVRWRGHPQWSGWISGSLQEGKADVFTQAGEETKTRDYISRIMPATAQVGVRWQSAGGMYWLETLGDFAEKADRLSDGDRRDTQRIPEGGTPGYAVATVRGGVELRSGLTFSLSVENVFDEDYRIHGSGVNQPGRNVIAMAQWLF
jgi:hemoglobin/transferrin/lactoferrin receptor protein